MCPSDPWFRDPGRHLLSGLLGLFWAALLGGCATAPTPTPTPEAPAAVAPDLSPEFVPVVRYGRYTLIELAPSAAQRDLLLQVVEVSTPDTLHATVADALRHVLRRSGYQLCGGQDTEALGRLPLPAAHYQLGPLVLRDALLTLTGPAWDLHVDDGTRLVCFSHVASAPTETEPQPTTAPDADVQVQTFPLAVEDQP
ncbi:PilL N-terminal domain-containing protein [Pseudoxanthomonas mexicana]|uniref:PFGI-1 class ICE element type IV pilus protein PilL2 n=1 Tax=Pseudoxanthomonas mexicana TaxID=128785 RepID=UPI00398AF91E